MTPVTSQTIRFEILHLPPEQLNLSSDEVFIEQHGSVQGSALDIAVIRGNVEMVSLLLQQRAKVHNVFYLIWSITLLLAKANVEKNVDQLLQMVATVTLTSDSDSAESINLWKKYSVIIQLLATHHSDFIERVQCTKPSCLYMACAFGVLEFVSLSLELGTDVGDLYRTDDSGSTYWLSLVTIICSGSLLNDVAHRTSTNTDITRLLCHVNWLKYSRIVSTLIEHGLDINHQDISGSFALGIASSEGQSDLVTLLLNSGKADVNLQNKEGMSSLMEASSNGHTEICCSLLHSHAKMNLQDKKGWSALMFAVMDGNRDLVAMFLKNGAQINLQDVTGMSSLMLSSFIGQADVVRVLLKRNAELNLQTHELS